MMKYGQFSTITIILLFLLPLQVEARTKCWTIDGETECGDVLPPHAIPHGYREFDDRGIPRNRVGPAPTDKDIERKKALEALRAEQEKIREEQQAYDRRLLELYPDQDDLLRARDRKIEQLDAQVKFNLDTIERLKNRLAKLQSEAAERERRGGVPTQHQLAALEDIQRSILEHYELVRLKEQEKKAVTEQYAFDRERLRHLHKEASAKNGAESISQQGAADGIESAVICRQGTECDTLWSKAREYARSHATTPVALAADRIFSTAPARDIQDISITVSRLTHKDEGKERIFLDVQCARHSEGRKLCQGPIVSGIRKRFSLALGRGSVD